MQKEMLAGKTMNLTRTGKTKRPKHRFFGQELLNPQSRGLLARQHHSECLKPWERRCVKAHHMLQQRIFVTSSQMKLARQVRKTTVFHAAATWQNTNASKIPKIFMCYCGPVLGKPKNDIRRQSFETWGRPARRGLYSPECRQRQLQGDRQVASTESWSFPLRTVLGSTLVKGEQFVRHCESCLERRKGHKQR